MNHRDHVELIRGGLVGGGLTWADLGSGTGAFTLALADLLGSAGTIYSVDRDAAALGRQSETMQGRFPDVEVHYVVGDFTDQLTLPSLDGIVMANSLHFVNDKRSVIGYVRGYLQPRGRLVLVEYDTDQGNPWVPYPISWTSWARLATEVGLAETRKLTTVPSRFLGAIYSAVSVRP